MANEFGGYHSALVDGSVLERRATDSLLRELKTHLSLEAVPLETYTRSSLQPGITEELMRLPLFVASGHASWGGLVVCFPGSKEQLATGFVGTPYLRKILYPILDLHQRVQDFHGQRLPCLYLLGARFPDVILRKFGLLDRLSATVLS